MQKIISTLLFCLFTMCSTSCQSNESVPWQGFKHEYAYSLRENNAAILDRRHIKPRDKLFFIEKKERQWKVTQTIEHLQKILGDYLLADVIHNEEWLCIRTDYRYDTTYKARIFLFQRRNGQWEYVDFIEGKTVYFDHAEITDDNILYFSENLLKFGMGVYAYDLNQTPPKLIHVIKPPRQDGGDGFGRSFHVYDDTLFVTDTGAVYSKEEEKRYKITLGDRIIHVDDNGRHYMPPVWKWTVVAYRWTGNEWKYECDFYDLLPHPKDNGLRKDKKSLNGSTERYYYPLIRFDADNRPNVVNGQLYLTASDQFYVFERDENDQWKFKERFNPPKLRKYEPHPGEIVFYNDCAPVRFGEKYSIAARDDSTFDIVKTDRIKEWQPLWNTFYGSEELHAAEITERVNNAEYLGVGRSGDIVSNTALFFYNSRESFEPAHSLRKQKVWGGISIFEIDDQEGPKEVFRMETNDDSGLHVVDMKQQ